MNPGDYVKPLSNADQQLWRYMSVSKFLNLISTGELYFTRADRLGDKWEGSISEPHNLYLMSQSLRGARNIGPGGGEGSPAQREQILRRLRDRETAAIRKLYANCWYRSEHESTAMWSLYGAANETVCIRTTYGRLKDELPSYAIIGEVDYLDYQTTSTDPSPLRRFFQKRISFAHEREVRAVIREEDAFTLAGDEGKRVNVKLDNLLEQVFISPDAPAWLSSDLIIDILRKYNYATKVKKSILGGPALS